MHDIDCSKRQKEKCKFEVEIDNYTCSVVTTKNSFVVTL